MTHDNMPFTMNAHSQSRSSTPISPISPGRCPRPRRPLPALPIDQATVPPSQEGPKWPEPLVKDDPKRPFQLLDAPPLSLLCTFHNVKRVSLEDGVPPPFRFDVPIIADCIEDPDVLFPTHMLAVYDQDPTDATSPVSQQPLLSTPYLLPPQPTEPGAKPNNPIMIPVNSIIWSRCFTKALGTSTVPPASPARPSSVPTSHRASIQSTSSLGRPSSGYGNRASRAILTLPVHIMKVPNAQALPLLLLAAFNVIPRNSVAPLLLPRRVLSDFPSPPAVLAQRLLRWLYRSSSHPSSSHRFSHQSTSSNRSRRGSRAKDPSNSPSTPSRPSTPAQPIINTSEPVCVLTDPTTSSDPDLRLIYLAQQNFGLWANALALGVKDDEVTHLVELGWSVSAEARRVRFSDLMQEREGENQLRPRSRAASTASATPSQR